MSSNLSMDEISITGNSLPETLRCTVCLLPMQYQSIKNGKFVWQCFKCGKQYLISRQGYEYLESWSPTR